MTRSEALAPLKTGEARLPANIGLINRAAIRRLALFYGVNYYEEKGWLTSTFIFRGPADRVLSFQRAAILHLGED